MHILSGNSRGNISHANIAGPEAIMESGFSGPKLEWMLQLRQLVLSLKQVSSKSDVFGREGTVMVSSRPA